MCGVDVVTLQKARAAAPVGVLDAGIFVAALTACAVLFTHGGAGGVFGAALGALAGWRMPAYPHARVRSLLEAAFAGLWAGVMIGGMVAFALTL